MHQEFQDTGILEALYDNYVCLDIACVNSDLSDGDYHEEHQRFAIYRRQYMILQVLLMVAKFLLL
jgi:hypothetical protein